MFVAATFTRIKRSINFRCGIIAGGIMGFALSGLGECSRIATFGFVFLGKQARNLADKGFVRIPARHCNFKTFLRIRPHDRRK
jgi:hypothetical protein